MTGPNTQGSDPGSNADQGTGGHPAWSEILSVVPPELHGQITPVLQKWDQGVNERFQQLHSESAPYKEYMDQYSPEDIQQAINLAQMLQTDPNSFYQQLIEAAPQLGIELADFGQGQEPEPQQVNGFGNGQQAENPYDDRFSSIEAALGSLAEMMLNNQQSAEQAQEDAELEAALSGLHKQFGDFDDDYVITKIAGGMEPDKAVEAFYQLTGKNPAAQNTPPVIGSGGGLPSSREDINRMNPKDTEAMVTRMLEQARSNSG